jgi:hypothetical protein
MSLAQCSIYGRERPDGTWEAGLNSIRPMSANRCSAIVAELLGEEADQEEARKLEGAFDAC